MTNYNYKEPNPEESARTIAKVKRFLPNLIRKVHDAVTNNVSAKQPLQKEPNQNA